MSKIVKFVWTVGTGFDKDDKTVPAQLSHDVVRRIKHAIARAFGGVSVAHGQGAWIDNDGTMVSESNVTFTALDTRSAGLAAANAVAHDLRVALNQTSVLLTVESVDSVHFVEEPADACAI